MKRTKTIKPLPDVWRPEVYVGEVRLTPGVEVAIRGERGRFRFVKAWVSSAGRIGCDFLGPDDNTRAFRSFYAERITFVHPAGTSRRSKAA